MNLTGQAPYTKGEKRRRLKSLIEREEEAYNDWVREQKSCITGKIEYDPETGASRNEPAHVRRVKWGSGTGKKSPLTAVPLTHEEHADQHQKGEAYCLRKHHPTKRNWTEAEAKQFFENQREIHVGKWRAII